MYLSAHRHNSIKVYPAVMVKLQIAGVSVATDLNTLTVQFASAFYSKEPFLSRKKKGDFKENRWSLATAMIRFEANCKTQPQVCATTDLPGNSGRRLFPPSEAEKLQESSGTNI